MAYLFSFDSPASGFPAALPSYRGEFSVVRERQASPRVTLSALEWSVVALASTDPLSSLRAPGRFAIAMGGIFGTRHNPGLACPRLETLRRVAVHIWRERPLPEDELASFKDVGFTDDHIDLILASIARYEAQSTTHRKSLL